MLGEKGIPGENNGVLKGKPFTGKASREGTGLGGPPAEGRLATPRLGQSKWLRRDSTLVPRIRDTGLAIKGRVLASIEQRNENKKEEDARKADVRGRRGISPPITTESFSCAESPSHAAKLGKKKGLLSCCLSQALEGHDSYTSLQKD